MKYHQPKGTYDILPKQLKLEDHWKTSDKWQYLEKLIHELCKVYGFNEIRTPIFESTDLFIRSVGDASDIVSKEMYSFEDKGKRPISLRPEGTASTIRSFVENHLEQHGQDHNLYYIGPFFRYDRPQAGRYRQFHQFGVECIGRADPFQDAEIIDMLLEFYKKLGINNLTVLINSVGDSESRANYSEALKNYLQPYFEKLSKESQERFFKNPLRILDTKDENDQLIIAEAPTLEQFLSENAKKHFEQVCDCLTSLGISYKIDPKLVRGLDYYNKTVFEIQSSALGAQNTIGAGGRYDGLLKKLGGPDLPSIGFATGIERVLHTMAAQNCKFPDSSNPFYFIIGLGEKTHKKSFELLSYLRHKGVPSKLYIKSHKIQKGLEQALHENAEYCIIIGENELAKEVLQIKNLKTRQNQEIQISSAVYHLTQTWETEKKLKHS